MVGGGPRSERRKKLEGERDMGGGGGGGKQAKRTQERHVHMQTVRKINIVKPKGGYALCG